MIRAQNKEQQEMMILLIRDPWTIVSLLGISMIAVVHWITENINPLIATVTLLLGVALLVLGIIEKWQIVKSKWKVKIKIPRKK